MHRRPFVVIAAILAVVGVLASCSRRETADAAPATDLGPAAELRLGYLPNITHAAALIGAQQGLFALELGSTKLTPQTFNAGPDEVSALLGGSLDAGFLGSGPAINAFAKSNGTAVRLIAGATSGGAQLVVEPGITSPDQLRGKKIATPQLANTQDIAFKKWLKDKGLATGTAPDQVQVVNTDNARALDAFRTGQLDGGWLPEPFASRLVLEAGAHLLVDEASLWPGGKFPTTVLLVRTQYLAQHPQTVAALLRGELAATDRATADPAQAKATANAALQQLTGKPLRPDVLDRAYGEIALTVDPLAAPFPQLAKDSVTAGVATSAPDLHGFLDLGPLNQVLAAAGRPAVDAAGLDIT